MIPYCSKGKGVFIDRATEQPLPADGEQVLSEIAFTPKELDGSVSLAYTLDSRKLEDVRNVAIEIKWKMWYTISNKLKKRRDRYE